MDDESEKIFSDYRNHLWNSLHSSHEQFDKAILTLSSGGLVLSLSFLKDMSPALDPYQGIILIISWIFFSSAILSTVISLVLSQKAITRQIYHAEKYYMEKNDKFLNKRNIFSVITKYLNYLSGSLFFMGVIATVFFASASISKGREEMTKNTPEKNHRGYVPPSLQQTPRPNPGSGYIPPSMPEAPQKPNNPPPKKDK